MRGRNRIKALLQEFASAEVFDDEKGRTGSLRVKVDIVHGDAAVHDAVEV